MHDPQEVLLKYWGFKSFRPVQESIIRTSLEGKDVLALLPTGGGKSVCYQVPAMCSEGICLVISPLIALMKDQVDGLRRKGIRALAINSNMSKREIDVALDNCIYGEIKFLYVSPERLSTELFIERFKQMKVSLIAIDEAHCISQWGYDFRPSYLTIATLRELRPELPIMALTATATLKVRDDICEKLAFKNPAVFCGSFARANLSFSVRTTEDKERKLIQVLRAVPGSSVVYVRSRNRAKELSILLSKNGIPADYYHAGLSADNRSRRQEAWLKNEVPTIVATNAFGMGIDKSNVRLVVHYDLPENIEAYYQEAGRAGRDGQKAFAVILLHKGDKDTLMANFERSHPSIELIRRVYQALANQYKLAVGSGALTSFDFDLMAFCASYKLQPSDTFHAMKKLEEGGFIELNEGFYQPSRIWFQVKKERLYEFQIAHAAFDPLIKLLLRLYGAGVFNSFTSIAEMQLARMLNTHSKDVEQKLMTMAKAEILVYEKARDKPQIIFLTPRYDARELPLNIKYMRERKQLKLEQLQTMLKYVEQIKECRSAFITAYFGEETMPCGVCDVCVDRKKGLFSDPGLKNALLKTLKSNPLETEALVESFPEDQQMEVLAITRQMIDAGILKIDSKGRLLVAS
ncbi:MAG: ATP-dependent DNA helicase RecQ [Cyclobacteriaceae bacterium]